MSRFPYEMLDYETKKAFEAFVIYRDMGTERSIRKVAQKLGKNQQLISRWSAQYDWVNRSNAYDAEMDRQALLQQEKERKAMVKRHAQQAMLYQQKALERLNQMKPEELEPKDLIRFFSEAVKIERLSRGEPTEAQSIEHTGKNGGPIQVDKNLDLSKLSDEELAVLESLISKSTGPPDTTETS